MSDTVNEISRCAYPGCNMFATWNNVNCYSHSIERQTMHGTRVEYNSDPINPQHYKSHPSGIQCIDVVRYFDFNIGNAIKYLWRFKQKNGVEDLRKAIWYIEDQIKLLEKK